MSDGWDPILRKQHPKSKYTGVAGTARMIGERAVRAVAGGVERNSGLSGQAARTLRDRPDELARKIDEIDKQSR